jgi:hypothetical protein|tara:strand:+ start:2654 stop:3202 length:549 start_codon:yes stop_codon:yes gene_type:complete
MGAIVNDGDVKYIRSCYPELEIKEPTGQQEKLILHYFRGMAIGPASEQAGYKNRDAAQRYLRTDSAVKIIELLKSREFDDVRIDKDMLTGMLLETYHMSATGGEKVSCVRELGKMHSIYPDQNTHTVDINLVQQGEVSQRQLASMTDAQLAAVLGTDLLTLPKIVEAEFEVVKEAIDNVEGD